MTRIVITALFILTVFTAGCGRKSGPAIAVSKPVEAGTTNAFFTAVSVSQIKTAPGVRTEPVVAADGSVRQFNLIAKDNRDSQTVTCECFSACSGGNCNMIREELDTVVQFTCTGGCRNSEGNAGCSCVFTLPPDNGTGTGTRNNPVTTGSPLVNTPR